MKNNNSYIVFTILVLYNIFLLIYINIKVEAIEAIEEVKEVKEVKETTKIKVPELFYFLYDFNGIKTECVMGSHGMLSCNWEKYNKGFEDSKKALKMLNEA